jgi:predicted enzyme related to lactoylglutathione lyase
MSTSSKFVWHDLMTPDPEAAQKFYGELLGWKFERGKDNSGYVHITAGDQMIGGIMKPQAPGIPPHWMGYIAVDDVDRTVASIQKHGGKVLMPAMDIPHVGRFAVTADPQGASFAPFKDAGEHPAQPETNAPPALYTFCWDELLTKDAQAAGAFYDAVFGWRPEKMEMPGMGSATYTLLKRVGVKDDKGTDKNAGGIMQSPPDAKHPPFWMLYVAVPDANATAEKVKRLGGKVMMEPMAIPTVGKFFPAMDPQGAAIAFLAPTP